MPEISSTRVKNTGYGDLEYTNPTYETANAAVAQPSVTGGVGGINSINGINIGVGDGIFAGANGYPDVVLEFKSIRAGAGIQISDNGNELTITALNTGGGPAGNAISDAFHLNLGDLLPFPGALPFVANTSVSNAIEQINLFLNLLVPPAPPSFPNGVLTIINTTGYTPLLASGVIDHASSSLVHGSAVSRVIAGASTNILSGVGPGDSGNLQLLMNDGVDNDISLTGNDNGTYDGLVISNQRDFPANSPGFHKAIDVSVVDVSSPTGVNKIKLNHTDAGSTNEVFFVHDDMTATPVISLGSVSQSSAGAVAYSSSVPHYNASASLMISASYTNISGKTYYGGADPFTINGTNAITSAQIFSYQNLGIATPIDHDITAPTAITPVLINIDGTMHGSGVIQGVARNVNGSSAATVLASTVILVKRGTAATTKVDEMSVPVIGLGTAPNSRNAVRVTMLSSTSEPAIAPTTWNPEAPLQPYDAAVIGGLLSNNQTNYSTGYLPVGPDLSSGRNNPQFITFSFNRSSVSTFKINVTGTYSGVWIKLPGVSDNTLISPHSINGWWNGYVSYNGAGVPGNPSDLTQGCAVGSIMNGTSGSFTMTFGPQTSTNASGNTILVRIRLNAGQSISALSFSN